MPGVFSTPPDVWCCLTTNQVLTELNDLQDFCQKPACHARQHLVLPRGTGAAWANILPNLCQLDTLNACQIFSELGEIPPKQLFTSISDLHDVGKRPIPGLLVSAQLPDSLRCLPHILEPPRLICLQWPTGWYKYLCTVGWRGHYQFCGHPPGSTVWITYPKAASSSFHPICLESKAP
jgi:hypothetical protein